MSKKFIPVNNPVMDGNEKAYVLDCLESSWISSSGKYLDRFEEAFAEFCNVKYAVACSNGTAALHLALLALGLEPGDEVLIPDLTFIATANAVTYCGGTPVFVDIEPETWNIDPELIEGKISSRTKGIIVVHFRGHPADMDPILKVAGRHGLFVIEDAAQSHGAEYKGRMTGSLGNIGTFSFFGNKIVTAGEGGMIVTNDESCAKKMRLLKNQGMENVKRYWHPVVGFNYRLTNVAAAIGLAQLEKIASQIDGRTAVASWYQEYFQKVPGFRWQGDKESSNRVWFLFTLVVEKEIRSIRDGLIPYLLENGIDSRPVYYPLHSLPIFPERSGAQSYPVAEYISERGVNLPTWAGMTREDVVYIGDKIVDYLRR
ncbi:MAG: DegT/DnrJ/EryC1/StrS family aminotransferase [Desulfuromonadaceae bacterium]|nr:DegT/DnrJ/EryC1/StrS family aminotransferase [Desulfuromonadaceae bacterium]